MQTVWVEIPVKNIERAAKFYSNLLGGEYAIHDDGVRKIAVLNRGGGNAAGASLTQTDNFEPSDTGPLIYIQAGDDLSGMLTRVEPAGGKVVMEKTSMGESGFFATFQDTEGNVLALYSMN